MNDRLKRLKRKKTKRDVFQKEHEIIDASTQFLIKKREPLNADDRDELLDKYSEQIDQYKRLVNVSQLLTSVSDKLHLKLNKLNSKLQVQSEEIIQNNDALRKNNIVLKDTIDELAKERIGRKAMGIVLVIAVLLFIISEGIIEPKIEMYTDSIYIGLLFKGLIALALKPIDLIVERYLRKDAIATSNKANREFEKNDLFATK